MKFLYQTNSPICIFVRMSLVFLAAICSSINHSTREEPRVRGTESEAISLFALYKGFGLNFRSVGYQKVCVELISKGILRKYWF